LDHQRRNVVPGLAESATEAYQDRRIARLDGAVQTHLGEHLRRIYADPADTKLPRDLRQRANHLIQVIRAHTIPNDGSFTTDLMASLPALRAFAISLTRDLDRAEDLLQSTILKGISRQELFTRGTNLQAWLFTVMRNEQYSQFRSRRREIEDVDGEFAEALMSLPEQEGRMLGHEIGAALTLLSEEQRCVLLLVGVQGMAYEDAAEALGCSLGTIKSRLNRARNRLAELLKLEPSDVGRRSFGSTDKAQTVI